MKYTIHIPILVLLAIITLSAQEPEQKPDEKNQDNERISREQLQTIEKTDAIFEIANNASFLEIEALAKTKPTYSPDSALGCGAHIAEFRIYKAREDGDMTPPARWYRIIFYNHFLVRIIEVNRDGNTEHHHLLGWYVTRETWKNLRIEIFRQSEAIKQQRNKKSRSEILWEEWKKSQIEQQGENQEGEQVGGCDGEKPPS